MNTLKERVISAYTRENYPNAQIEKWDDPDCTLEFYTAQQLHALEGDWFPLCCYRDKTTGQTVYGGRAGVVHTYTEGETGAGKTSRFAMQSIRALSATKGRPSFVVVDIHGELVENLYDHLRQSGYEVRILNCDDPAHSDTYNPFAPLVRQCQLAGEMTNEVINQLRKIAEIMQPTESTDDPIWDQGACSYTNGLILDKFEDLLAGNIPPEAITIYNIIENHYWLRRQLSGGYNSSILNIPHYSAKSNALSLQKIISVTNNAEKTRASYFGVVENHFDVFGQPSLYRLSSNSTIDIEDFIDRPTAIFIQSGTTRVGDDLISLLMNEIYNTAVRLGRMSPTKMLPRKIHCFLDEFANSDIAKGPEFIRMLTTSRKFGMYWHMLLQCDAQLERKFDANIGRIIRANCTEIFMGSQDHETMVRFARSCGQKTVESLSSLVAGQSPSLDTVDLITPDKLSLTPEGCVYIKTNRRPLLYSYIEAFFHCPEFKPAEDILSVYPTNTFDYTSTVFFPDDVPPVVERFPFRILQMLHIYGPLDTQTLCKALPGMHVRLWLKVLLKAELIREKLGTNCYECCMKPAAYRLLSSRYDKIAAPCLPEQKDEPEVITDMNMVEAFRKTYSNHRNRQMMSVEMETLDLTCLPLDLHLEINALMRGDRFVGEGDLPVLADPLLYERIFEQFIRANSITGRDSAVRMLFKECGEMRRSGLFPAEFMAQMDMALKLLRETNDDELLSLKKALGKEA